MSRGHGVIINLATYLPWVFDYNPTEIDTVKKINYFVAPNIGGSFHEKFFTGFDNKEVKLSFQSIDMENPLGVQSTIAYFEELREPAPGLLGIAGSFFGNENYPPPQVLFGFGVSLIPLVWDPIDVQIKETHFHDGKVRGVIGVPKRCEITLTLSLDENSILYKSNQIAKKALAVAGSITSIQKEVLHKQKSVKKSSPGIFPSSRLKDF